MTGKLTIGIFLMLLLHACSWGEDAMDMPDGVEVGFKALAETPTPENLAQGVTVRVMVYRRTGTSADLSADTYITENTYKAQADGTLIPCVTDNNGNEIADTPKPLRLPEGTYDFYAITPAIHVNYASAATVSVPHETDYATSLSENILIEKESVHPSGQNVYLTTLQRKCSLLEFAITRQVENITSVQIVQARILDMSSAPLTGVVAQDLSAATQTDDVCTLPGSSFVAGTQLYEKSGKIIVLPKTDGTFNIELALRFNGSSDQKILQSEVGSMALEPGKKYAFRIILRGEDVLLTLRVVDWNTPIDWNTDMGEGWYAYPAAWVDAGWQTEF